MGSGVVVQEVPGSKSGREPEVLRVISVQKS